MVPILGLKAVVLRPTNERIDVDAAIDSLERSSFIEIIKSEHDSELFVSVPLASAVFGRRKLQVDPMKAAVEADCRFLQEFGAVQESDIRHGLRPRVQRIFTQAARVITAEPSRLNDYLPVLQFVANSFPPAWLLLADLYEELARDGDIQLAKEAVLKFLELAPPDDGERFRGWERLARLARATNDAVTEVHSLVELCQSHNTPFDVLSDSANRINARFREGNAQLEGEEKLILIRKLIFVMASRDREARATDLSRLAWLCLNAQDEESARRYTRQGLRIEPSNFHCRKLADRLQLNSDPTIH